MNPTDEGSRATIILAAPSVPASPSGAWRGRLSTFLQNRYVLYVLVFIIAVSFWQFSATVLVASELLLPKPHRVLDALVDALRGPFWGRASVYYHTVQTAWVSIVGFAIGAGGGILLGVLMVQSRILLVALNPYITALQSLPRIAIAPIIIIWFGQGFKSLVIITATIAFLPVLISTLVGLQSVDRGLIDMLRGLSASRLQILRKVTFKASLPHVFAGLQVAVVFSIVGAIVAEWVGANKGLGVLLLLAQYSINVPRVFALLVILAALGLVLNGAVVLARNRILFWQPGNASMVGKGVSM